MAKEIKMYNEKTGARETGYEGFSWTMLFFGCFPPLFRGDYKYAIITFLASWITLGFSWIVFPFIYNGLHMKDLIKKGFVVEEELKEKAELQKLKDEIEALKNK